MSDIAPVGEPTVFFVYGTLQPGGVARQTKEKSMYGFLEELPSTNVGQSNSAARSSWVTSCDCRSEPPGDSDEAVARTLPVRVFMRSSDESPRQVERSQPQGTLPVTANPEPLSGSGGKMCVSPERAAGRRHAGA
jgi:hypothetical protein